MKKLFIFAIILLVLMVVLQACSKQESKCNYDSVNKRYAGRSISECSTIKFMCEAGRQGFEDDCGCGCEKIELKANSCTTEQRKADACIALYQPVCGWFDPEEIQCFKYPCATTFSNSCEACRNKNVVYWTDGECPK